MTDVDVDFPDFDSRKRNGKRTIFTLRGARKRARGRAKHGEGENECGGGVEKRSEREQ
jgi:hypothetical protein